jgi:hypothetical protein
MVRAPALVVAVSGTNAPIRRSTMWSVRVREAACPDRP